MNYKVKFNILEMLIAGLVGLMRRFLSLNKGLKDNKRAPNHEEKVYDIDVNGAIYEMAVAKFLDVYWQPTVNTFKKPDVAGYQVRGTMHPNGRLIYRRKDSKNEPYILVVGKNYEYEIMGWMTGNEIIKHDEWISNPNWKGKCWMVPQNQLNKKFEIKEHHNHVETFFK